MTWLGSENSILHYNIPYWQRDIFSEWSCDPFSSLKNALWSDLKNTREGASKVLVNLVFSCHFWYSVHCSQLYEYYCLASILLVSFIYFCCKWLFSVLQCIFIFISPPALVCLCLHLILLVVSNSLQLPSFFE